MADPVPPPDPLMTFEEFYRTAEPDTVVAEVMAEVRRERAASPVDRDTSRMNETWSLLANQVVGQEKF